MHPKILRFKPSRTRRRWGRSLIIASVVVLIPFVMVPLLTQANLLNRPVEEVTITFTEGTNMAAAPSPNGGTIILAIQGSLWSIQKQRRRREKAHGLASRSDLAGLGARRFTNRVSELLRQHLPHLDDGTRWLGPETSDKRAL